MRKFRIYSANYCPYCKEAALLLLCKGVSFEVIDVTNDDEARAKLFESTGMSTVPQIFLDDEFIGGCTTLLAHEESGELDNMIKGEDND